MKDILEAICKLPQLLKRAQHDAHVCVALFLHLQIIPVQAVTVQAPGVLLWSELSRGSSVVSPGCCLMHKESSIA